MKVVIVYIN